VFFIVLALLVLLAAMFAYSNPEPIAVDVGFARLENVSVSVAFSVAFSFGWVFGLLCAGLILMRLARERRRLRRELRIAEAELSSLRSLPLHDAN
jgi:uncharacterized membrane protein YciS (DUF1049 family)